ncbi:MAG: hypothetical protein ACI38U_12935 [Corynebacterium sp.]
MIDQAPELFEQMWVIRDNVTGSQVSHSPAEAEQISYGNSNPRTSHPNER